MNNVRLRSNSENQAQKKKNRISRLFKSLTLLKEESSPTEKSPDYQSEKWKVDKTISEGNLFKSISKLELTEEDQEVTSCYTPSTTASEVDTLTLTETDVESDSDEFLSEAFNIDDLYTEVLYVILHNIGCDISDEIIQSALFSYVQEAFKITDNKHKQLFEIAKNKEAPDRMINVEIIEGIELEAKNPNGLSDPFVILYLTSNTPFRHETSIITNTLNPVWKERFKLSITEKSTKYDELCFEVWDFNAPETLKQKLEKVGEAKGVKGMKKFIKKLGKGQHDHKLIGRAKILLNTIPASGMTTSYPLEKKNKEQRQGILKVKISFCSGKNLRIAEQEHRHIRNMVLLHELESSQVAPYWWCGNFSDSGKKLLIQHIAQSGLSETKVSLCSYVVYAEVHQNHPLNFALFLKLLEEISRLLLGKKLKSSESETAIISEKNIKLFWKATTKLLPSCFSIIKDIRKRAANETTVMKQVTEVLKILQYICILNPKDIDLFPDNLYPWSTYHGIEPNCDIRGALNDAVSQGASDFFNNILKNLKESDGTNLSRMQYLIQIVNLMRSDLEKAVEYHDKLFLEHVNFQYPKCLYIFYQDKLAQLFEQKVLDICKGLKGPRYRSYSVQNILALTDSPPPEDPLAEGTLLFELYLTIQKFVAMGHEICPIDYKEFVIKSFYQWFYRGVIQWLDIAVFKALAIIEKAVDVDNFVHIDDLSKWSSSAVDTLAMLYEVKVFWKQLNWPDVEGCYTFIEKIIDDICRCCIFYADKIYAKVDRMEDNESTYRDTFKVTTKWCLVINNTEHVWECLEPFTQDLGLTDVVKKINKIESSVSEYTHNNVISSAINSVKNKMTELIKNIVNKMAFSIKKLLIDGAELDDISSNRIDVVMMYVDTNLATLHGELNKENFNKAIEFVRSMLSNIFSEITQSSLEKRRPPSFFAFLEKTLTCILKYFEDCFEIFQNDSVYDTLKRTEKILRINGLETPDLIHEVHLELANTFEQLKESSYGEISFRCKFEEDALKMELMNARDLPATNSKGTCDSYVKIHFLPEHKFSNIEKLKTKIHHKTLFPLYDEIFTVRLGAEQTIEDGLVLLSVKDKNKLKISQYMGEAFIRFKDIPNTNEPLTNLPQVKKWILRPTSLETDAVKVLETRLSEKQAKEFLKKFKQRMGS